MAAPRQRPELRRIVKRLAELLDASPAELSVRSDLRAAPAGAVIQFGRVTFVVEWQGSGAAATVFAAAEQAQRHAAALGRGARPLVAVPYMGPVGRQHCEKVGVGWLDLSGNAHVVAPGIRIQVLGEPNRFKHAGRPSSAFAPKSARVARWLLMHPDRSMTQREIAQATELGEGFVSRIVRRLEEDGLLLRATDRTIRPRDPDRLLDAWREHYDFTRHTIIRGHIPARSGEALLERVGAELGGRRATGTATGLAAAWLLTRFAGFRLVTFYLRGELSDRQRERLSFHEDARGANVWLVVPNDAGVFHGAAEVEGVPCVHPVQAYLDLQGHPERAAEAADQLRRQRLKWKTHA